jgi:hypothetical protein
MGDLESVGLTVSIEQGTCCGRAILALVRVRFHGQDARATDFDVLWQGHPGPGPCRVHGQDARATDFADVRRMSPTGKQGP